MRCDKTNCSGPIKPNIVFFGEALPAEFMMTMMNIQGEVDLCLIMGTALAVAPFNAIPQMIGAKVPRVLFNMENTNSTGGIDFTEPNHHKLFVQGKCDETIRKLVADCGWSDEFEAILPDVHKTQPNTQ